MPLDRNPGCKPPSRLTLRPQIHCYQPKLSSDLMPRGPRAAPLRELTAGCRSKAWSSLPPGNPELVWPNGPGPRSSSGLMGRGRAPAPPQDSALQLWLPLPPLVSPRVLGWVQVQGCKVRGAGRAGPGLSCSR